MTQTFRLIFGSKRKQFLDVLKYGASRLANHVSGEEATEFMQSAIELEQQLDHEELLGQKLTNQQRQMLEEIFESLHPVDGRVGIAGLRALYLSMGLDPTDDELELTIKQIDRGGYGTVSLEEFINNL